jgi:hypothetical protein
MKMINSIAPTRFLNFDPNLSKMSDVLRNEIYQSVLNYSNVLISLDSHLMNSVFGIAYFSLPYLGEISPFSCLKAVQLSMKEIYLRKFEPS